jgi:hypothetical protein
LCLLVEIGRIPDCDVAYAVCVPHLEDGAAGAEWDPARGAFTNSVRLIRWIKVVARRVRQLGAQGSGASAN